MVNSVRFHSILDYKINIFGGGGIYFTSFECLTACETMTVCIFLYYKSACSDSPYSEHLEANPSNPEPLRDLESIADYDLKNRGTTIS